eukprot:m.1637932 g.1637932  ORF g.1637932 m.1637932 type:complete len:162 (+) comp26378_c0_seq1:150-635(+)
MVCMGHLNFSGLFQFPTTPRHWFRYSTANIITMAISRITVFLAAIVTCAVAFEVAIERFSNSDCSGSPDETARVTSGACDVDDDDGGDMVTCASSDTGSSWTVTSFDDTSCAGPGTVVASGSGDGCTDAGVRVICGSAGATSASIVVALLSLAVSFVTITM